MNVAVAPFLSRALRLTARTGRTYLLRSAVGVFFLLAFATVQARSAYYGAPGLFLFGWVAYASAVVILLSGPAYFASVISDEKEQLTLGLLKMTGLRSFSLLAGLSAGQMISAASLLLVIVPFAVLSVSLGGLAATQVWAATVALLAHLLFVAAVGLLCSVLFARSTRAGGAAGVLLLLFFAVPLMMAGTRPPFRTFPAIMGLLWRVNRFLHHSSVFVRLSEVLSTGYAGGIVGLQVISNIAMACVFFAIAWSVFEPCTRRTEGVGAGGGASRLAKIRGLRPGRAWHAAVAWKDFHFMTGGKVNLIVRFVAFLIGVLGAYAYGMLRPRSALSTEEIGGIVITFALMLAALESAIQASRMFNLERRDGTLSSLAALPHSPRRVAWEKIVGCAIPLIPYLIWLFLGLLMVPVDVGDFIEDVLFEPAALLGMFIGFLQFVIFLHLAAIFSLLLRRGGLVVAFLVYVFGIQFGASLLFMPFMLIGGGGFAVGVGCLGSVGIVLLLHWVLIRRLARVMSE